MGQSGRGFVNKTNRDIVYIKCVEKGYGMIPGVLAQPLNSWKEALEVKKQLLKDADLAQNENRETVFRNNVFKKMIIHN